MRLSQLQMKGFKSFADETVINFGEQLIGIVGPNGSGKSNIIDAIKWVLGEQKNKELRLETMRDVLFNGSKDRKEGRVARVTINFENTKNLLPTEYNDVSISRLIYRNGQSEYRLNDVTCRRKDITNLFLDSGLGSNSYAIISLSMVEDILTDKDNSRGRMIEEASGINKYKVRKRETLNKLKGTQVDLDRIEDLLFELESNLKAFEKQARRTEKYLKVKEKFKTISLSYAAFNVENLNSEINAIHGKLKDEQAEEATITASLNSEEADLQRVKKSIVEKEASLSEFQRKHNDLKNKIHAQENKKVLIQNEQKYLKSNFQALESSNTTLINDLKSLDNEIKINNTRYTKDRAEKESIEEKLKVKLKAFQAVKVIYDDLRSTLVSGQGERSKIAAEIESTDREISAKEILIDLLGEQLVSKKEDRNRLKNETNSLAERNEKLHIQHKKLRTDLDQKQKKLNQTEENRRQLQESISALSEAKKRLELNGEKVRQRIRILQNVIDNYEGFAESVQFLHGENKLKNAVFTDIIESRDDSYKDIVELYFHPYLQHVVVEDKREAYTLNELVRGAQKGKINFLVQKDFDGVNSEGNVNGLIPLNSVLKFEKEYENLVCSLAHNAYIFEGTLEELSRIDIPEDVSILLPKELLIRRRGELKGGSLTLFEGVNIGRHKNLKDFKANLNNCEEQLKEYSKQDETNNRSFAALNADIDAMREEIEKVNAQMNELEIRRSSSHNELELKKSLIRELDETISKADTHISRINAEVSKLRKLKEKYTAKNMQRQDLGEVRANFTKYHSDFEQARDAKDTLQRELVLAQNNLEILRRDKDTLKRSKADKESILSDNRKSRKKHESKSGKLDEEIDKIEKEILSLYNYEKEQFSQLSSREEEYFQLKSGVYDREKVIRELRGKRDQVNHLISGLKEKVAEKRLQLTSWKDRVEVEFNTDISAYKIEEEFSTQSLEELETQRDKLNVRLAGFGDINPLAIEAYNEIKLRYEKIATERDDILAAKENLEETISDIERTATSLFTEALDKIQFHFKEVFRQLFSEDDDCDIVLLDAQDPLESTIEIMAKPKGKQPKFINQLSGGEKTLTAVSFLFALYLIKPAPFCIFDEVDAPLDDVNVQKFNKIVKTFSRDSQFVIVTHNKTTMAEMDILYGVFMKEKGVSGVSAVDFRDFKRVDLFESFGTYANQD